MASIVVPGLDLAPSVPSRVVTVDVIDMTEGAPAAGAHIDFVLPQDLHASADGKILKAGTTRLTLDSSGHGEIRVPAYSPATKPDGWVLLVKKSWAPHPYPIRVPEGATKISLATLTPPVEVTDEMAQYLITDAAATITQGSQWDVSTSVSGGVASFAFTAPPGGEAWYKGNLTLAANLDALTPGAYQVASGAVAEAHSLPVIRIGVLEILSASPRTIRFTTNDNSPQGGSGLQVWMRSKNAQNTQWGEWELSWPIRARSVRTGLILSTTDVDALVDDGEWETISAAAAEGAGLPTQGRNATLQVVAGNSAGNCQQILWIRSANPELWTRSQISGGWHSWTRLDAADALLGAAQIVVHGASTPSQLAPDLVQVFSEYGVDVLNSAVGGQWASQTEFSVGSTPTLFTVTGGTIPASGAVQVTPTPGLKRDAGNLLPTKGWINGVYGTVRGTGTGVGQYQFTRSQSGTAKPTTGSHRFYPDLLHGGNLHILGTGKNDLNVGQTQSDYDAVIASHERMVSHWQSLGVDFLILGSFVNTGTLTSGTGATQRTLIQNFNQYCATKWPQNFLDLSALVTGSAVWDWLGITPTSTDTAQQAIGNMPPSLGDSHLNASGRAYVAYKVREWAWDKRLIGSGRHPLSPSVRQTYALSADLSLDDLTPGTWIAGTSATAGLGLPSEATGQLGHLEVFRTSATAGWALWWPRGGGSVLWRSSRTSGGWSAWTKAL